MGADVEVTVTGVFEAELLGDGVVGVVLQNERARIGGGVLDVEPFPGPSVDELVGNERTERACIHLAANDGRQIGSVLIEGPEVGGLSLKNRRAIVFAMDM